MAAPRGKLSAVAGAIAPAEPGAVGDLVGTAPAVASELSLTVELPRFVFAWLEEQAHGQLLTPADHACIVLCQAVAAIREKQAKRAAGVRPGRKVQVTPSGTSQSETRPAQSQAQQDLPGAQS